MCTGHRGNVWLKCVKSEGGGGGGGRFLLPYRFPLITEKNEYISSFIGNDYKKVGYLGMEVYNTPACRLQRALEGCKLYLVTLESYM